MVKLNLGSGGCKLDGFLSVDSDTSCSPDILADVTRLPFDDGSVDYIYASHILEHIDWSIDALLEWRRVLRSGGEIAIYVPDIIQMAAFFDAGIITREYFQATIYGAKLLGLDSEAHTHRRSYTPALLMNEMGRHFSRLSLATISSLPRERVHGEIVGTGVKID